MQCKEIECIIPSYIKGEEKEMLPMIRAHLADCSECREFEEATRALSSEVQKLPKIQAGSDFLNRVRTKIETENGVAPFKTGETTTRLKAIESRSAKVRVVSNKQTHKESFLNSLLDMLGVKLKSPALIYAVAIHVLVLGLSVYLYRAEVKVSKSRGSDAQWLRFQAYNNAIHSTIKFGKIKVESLGQKGEVYITQTSNCIQIQLIKPTRGNYTVATIENGELVLDQSIVDRYFDDNEVSILVYNNAVEVWSRAALEKYIQEEVSFSGRPV